MKRIEILLLKNDDMYYAITSVKQDKGLLSFMGDTLSEACIRATDYAVENNYKTVDIITEKENWGLTEFYRKHMRHGK